MLRKSVVRHEAKCPLHAHILLERAPRGGGYDVVYVASVGRKPG